MAGWRHLLVLVTLSASLTGCEPQEICTSLDVALEKETCGETANLNSAPHATILPSNYAPRVGDNVTFYAGAGDADGDTLYYEWDLDGDGEFEYAGAEFTPDARPSATVTTRYNRPQVL